MQERSGQCSHWGRAAHYAQWPGALQSRSHPAGSRGVIRQTAKHRRQGQEGDQAAGGSPAAAHLRWAAAPRLPPSPPFSSTDPSDSWLSPDAARVRARLRGSKGRTRPGPAACSGAPLQHRVRRPQQFPATACLWLAARVHAPPVGPSLPAAAACLQQQSPATKERHSAMRVHQPASQLGNRASPGGQGRPAQRGAPSSAAQRRHADACQVAPGCRRQLGNGHVGRGRGGGVCSRAAGQVRLG